MNETYCSQCGSVNPESEQGYTLCCNKRETYERPEPRDELEWDDPFTSAPKTKGGIISAR